MSIKNTLLSVYNQINQSKLRAVEKTKNQTQSESMNWKIDVSFSTHLIWEIKNFQNESEESTIRVGINKNPIILKNNVIPKPHEFPQSVKNKTLNIKRWSKKNPKILSGENGIFLYWNI